MKNVIISALLLQISSVVWGQQKIFDLVSYTLPKGFTEEKTPDRVTVTKADGTSGFCIITVFRSIDASNDSKNNFDLSWNDLVKKIIPVNQPAMQPTITENGWNTEVGSSVFEKEGINGTAILISSTKNKKLVNIQVLLNGADYIKDMTAFLESVSMKEAHTTGDPFPASVENKEIVAERKAADEIKTGPKAEVWVYFRLNFLLDPDLSAGSSKYDFEYFLVYPNGDYYPGFPLDGLHTLDNNNKQNDSWGKFIMNGNKGRFKSNYDVIELEKVSPILMKRPGYTYQLRKMVSVDGLLLDGAWGPYPDWEKQPHLSIAGYNGSGVRHVIAFNKNGSFTDYGFFVTNLSIPKEAPERAPGKGTYAIENFTLLLKYDDGRMVYKALTGAGSINPAADDKTLYINENACYKAGFNKVK